MYVQEQQNTGLGKTYSDCRKEINDNYRRPAIRGCNGGLQCIDKINEYWDRQQDLLCGALTGGIRSGGGFLDNSRAVAIQPPPAFVQRANPTPIANPFQANRNTLFGLGNDNTAGNSTNPTLNPNNPLPTDPAVTPPAPATTTDSTASNNTLYWALAVVGGVGLVYMIAK